MKSPKRPECYNKGCVESKYNQCHNFAGICDFRKTRLDDECNSKEVLSAVADKLIKSGVLK